MDSESVMIEQLKTIARAVRFDWHFFLLAFGIALWWGLALGPAIVAAWAVQVTAVAVRETAIRLSRK